MIYVELPVDEANRLLRTKPILRKNGFASVEYQGHIVRGLAIPGKTYWFEYHCWESPQSSDAEIWYRSHQQVTVLQLGGLEGADTDPIAYATLAQRCDAGEPVMYRVRFQDGLEWTVFEDELMSTRSHFSRPDPPKKSAPETNTRPLTHGRMEF